MSFNEDKARGNGLTRRTALQLGGAAAMSPLLGSQALAQAQDYPNGPITLIIPLPPGSLLDVMGRAFSDNFQKNLKHGFIIENVPGAASNIGVAKAARAKPDGKTMLFTVSSPVSTNQFLFKDMPFNTEKDLIPIILTGTAPVALVVHKDFPAKTLPEYIAYAKANPGEVAYGSSGPGSPQHLCAEFLAHLADIKLKHVPFKGTPETATAVVGGHVPSVFTSLSLTYEHAKSGAVRVLAICEDVRTKLAPEIPTVTETLPKFLHAPNGWQAMFVPAGTPKPIVDLLNKQMNIAIKDPELLDKLKNQFVALAGGTPEDLVKKMRDEVETTGQIVKLIGITPQ